MGPVSKCLSYKMNLCLLLMLGWLQLRDHFRHPICARCQILWQEMTKILKKIGTNEQINQDYLCHFRSWKVLKYHSITHLRDFNISWKFGTRDYIAPYHMWKRDRTASPLWSAWRRPLDDSRCRSQPAARCSAARPRWTACRQISTTKRTKTAKQPTKEP